MMAQPATQHIYALDEVARCIASPRMPAEYRALAHEVWAHRHRAGPMSVSTAVAINHALVTTFMLSMGLGEARRWPPFAAIGVTLAEMLEASAVVERCVPTAMKVADRCVAAIYALVHHDAGEAPVICYAGRALVIADGDMLDRLQGLSSDASSAAR